MTTGSVSSLRDINGNIVYPKSVASAIVYNNGTDTVEGMLNDGVYLTKDILEVNDVDPIDATTLDGHESKYFAKQLDMDFLTDQYEKSISKVQRQINVNSQRIDSFTTISGESSTSTTTEVELQDIRIKYDGSVSTSAGNAVREQISELKDLSLRIDSLKLSAEDAITKAEEALSKAEQFVPDDGSVRSVNGKGGLVTLTATDLNALPITGGTITGPVYLGSETYYIKEDGTANFSRAYGAYYNDYAELFPKGEETEPGDIIALDMSSDIEQYVKATDKSIRVAGVHSSDYAMVIGGEKIINGKDLVESNKDKYIPVALCGRVTTKVIGVVHKGDYIIPSDIPGVGKAAENNFTNTTQIVGYAVESDDRTDIRKIKIRVKT